VAFNKETTMNKEMFKTPEEYTAYLKGKDESFDSDPVIPIRWITRQWLHKLIDIEE
jgi:hypothetical protein